MSPSNQSKQSNSNELRKHTYEGGSGGSFDEK